MAPLLGPVTDQDPVLGSATTSTPPAVGVARPMAPNRAEGFPPDSNQRGGYPAQQSLRGHPRGLARHAGGLIRSAQATDFSATEQARVWMERKLFSRIRALTFFRALTLGAVAIESRGEGLVAV